MSRNTHHMPVTAPRMGIIADSAHPENFVIQSGRQRNGKWKGVRTQKESHSSQSRERITSRKATEECAPDTDDTTQVVLDRDAYKQVSSNRLPDQVAHAVRRRFQRVDYIGRSELVLTRK